MNLNCFAKIFKKDIENSTLDSRENLLRCFINFNTNAFGWSSVSALELCNKLLYKSNSRSKGSQIKLINHTLCEMVNVNHEYEITNKTQLTWDTKDTQIIDLRLSPERQNNTSQFVKVKLEEYLRIIGLASQSGQPAHKLLNFYLYLKSKCNYLGVEYNLREYCYPSMRALTKDLDCCEKSIKKILDIFVQYGIIFVVNFEEDKEQYTVYSPNHYAIGKVYCFQNYSKQDLMKEFQVTYATTNIF